jgi:hypothetical protein
MPTSCSIRSDVGCRSLVSHGHRRGSCNCHNFFHRRLNCHLFVLAFYTLTAGNDAELLSKDKKSSNGNMYDLYQDITGSNFGVRVIKLNKVFVWLAVFIRLPEFCGSILGTKASYPDHHIFQFLSNLAFILSRALVTIAGFGLVNGFVDRL